MIGPVILNDPGIAASSPGGHFLRLINSGNINYYKFNQKTRSIYVFTFSESKSPDRLDTFDFVKLTLKIITSARKHKTLQFFGKNWTIKCANSPKISDQSVEKQKIYATLNGRLESFDRYCIFSDIHAFV
jgi:hypothetical protein